MATVEAAAEFPIRAYGVDLVRRRSRQAAHRLLGDGGAQLVRGWIRAQAAATFARWRRRSRHVLGVHLRGTDKVVRAKVPPQPWQQASQQQLQSQQHAPSAGPLPA